jgi:hypothetical protein
LALHIPVPDKKLAVGRKKIKEERLRMKEKIGFKGSRGQGFEGQYHLSPGILESSICE